MSLKIGISDNDVLVDTTHFYILEGRKKFKNKKISKESQYIQQIFGVSEREEFMFILRTLSKYYKQQPKQGISDIINRFHRNEDEVHILSSRLFIKENGLLGEYTRHHFNKWLKQNKIEPTTLTYCYDECDLSEKLAACTSLDIDVLIESDPDVALYLAERGIKIILLNTDYNRWLEHENVKRVADWYDVYNEILNNRGNYIKENNMTLELK